MKSIFISCQSIDSPEPQMLISELRKKGFKVDHSPRNPSVGHDSRWADSYRTGIKRAIEQSQSFVIVLDSGWDSSTWMAVEADEASKKAEELGDDYLMAYRNPTNIDVKAKGRLGYLRRRLPNDVDKAIEALTTA